MQISPTHEAAESLYTWNFEENQAIKSIYNFIL